MKIESLMKEHIYQKNLRNGVWRAFASQKETFSAQLQAQLYTELETSAELSNNSIFSFLATTSERKWIVGKVQYNKLSLTVRF